MGSVELTPEDAFLRMRSEGDPSSVALAESIDRLFSLFEDELSDVYFIEHSIPYGRIVASNGIWVGHKTDLPSEFSEEGSFPLAFIVEGALEIYRPGGHFKNGRLTETVLYSGQFVGIFEAIQTHIGRSKPISSFWNITSGVTSVYAIDMFTQPHSRKLKEKYGVSVTAKDINAQNGLLKQSAHYSNLHKELERDWTTKILYFPKKLTRFIFQDKKSLANMDNPQRLAVIEARQALGDMALFAYARTFGTSYPLSSYFDELEVQFLQSLMSVRNSERPLFAISSNFDNSCPSSELSRNFCKMAGMPDSIIAPKRFEKLTVCGFIPLDHLVNSTKLHSQDRIEQFFSGLINKVRLVQKTDESLALVISKTLEGIHVNIGKGKHGSGVRIGYSDLNIQTVESSGPFFEKIASVRGWENGKIPTSDFFSRCVMLPINGE